MPRPRLVYGDFAPLIDHCSALKYTTKYASKAEKAHRHPMCLPACKRIDKDHPQSSTSFEKLLKRARDNYAEKCVPRKTRRQADQEAARVQARG